MARRPLVVALLVALLVACAGGTSPSEPTATPSPSPLPPAPTLVPEPTATATAETLAMAPALCSDPYPAGAPFESAPDEPIRLRPLGQPPALPAYQPLPFAVDGALEQVVRESIGEQEEHFAVVVKNLADGRGAVLDGRRSFYAASLFKTWVMLEFFHQRDAGLLEQDERYVVGDHYEQFALNPGELAVCDEFSLEDALRRMLRSSDNVAANLLLDRVGPGNVNASLRSLGLEASVIQPGALPTTAADMALLLEAVARRGLISPAASDEMLALLASGSIADRLPALLPEDTEVAHKTGNWENATHDAGIVFSPHATYVIVVLTDFGFRDDGATPIARLSRAVYDHYNGN